MNDRQQVDNNPDSTEPAGAAPKPEPQQTQAKLGDGDDNTPMSTNENKPMSTNEKTLYELIMEIVERFLGMEKKEQKELIQDLKQVLNPKPKSQKSGKEVVNEDDEMDIKKDKKMDNKENLESEEKNKNDLYEIIMELINKFLGLDKKEQKGMLQKLESIAHPTPKPNPSEDKKLENKESEDKKPEDTKPGDKKSEDKESEVKDNQIKVFSSKVEDKPGICYGDQDKIKERFTKMVEGVNGFQFNNKDKNDDYGGYRAITDKEKGILTLTFPSKEAADQFKLDNRDVLHKSPEAYQASKQLQNQKPEQEQSTPSVANAVQLQK